MATALLGLCFGAKGIRGPQAAWALLPQSLKVGFPRITLNLSANSQTLWGWGLSRGRYPALQVALMLGTGLAAKATVSKAAGPRLEPYPDAYVLCDLGQPLLPL